MALAAISMFFFCGIMNVTNATTIRPPHFKKIVVKPIKPRVIPARSFNVGTASLYKPQPQIKIRVLPIPTSTDSTLRRQLTPAISTDPRMIRTAVTPSFLQQNKLLSQPSFPSESKTKTYKKQSIFDYEKNEMSDN